MNDAKTQPRSGPGPWVRLWLERLDLHVAFSGLAIAALFLFIWWADTHLNAYIVRVLNTAAIYVIAASSFNLINGVTGQFSLGPNGFMALGGFTVALLVLPVEQKQQVWFLEPLVWPFSAFSLPKGLFVVAVAAGGLVAAVAALAIGYPTLRLRGDYLAIATFGFGEIIYIVANNVIRLTNGALGIKGIPDSSRGWPAACSPRSSPRCRRASSCSP